MKEKWSIIKELPNYEISNYGKVRNINTKRILSNTKTTNGYYKVTIDRKNYLIHRLVAKAFVQNNNPKIFICVNHKDENKLNNVYINLEWCTKQYNSTYGSVLNKISDANTACSIIKYDEHGNIIEIFKNANSIGNHIIQNALSKPNFINRYYDGYYYFKSYEKFDKTRRRYYYKITVYKDNEVVKVGNLIEIARYLHIPRSSFKNIINKDFNNCVIKDYKLKIEMI